jgi:hypothetical protein
MKNNSPGSIIYSFVNNKPLSLDLLLRVKQFLHSIIMNAAEGILPIKISFMGVCCIQCMAMANNNTNLVRCLGSKQIAIGTVKKPIGRNTRNNVKSCSNSRHCIPSYWVII